MNTVRSWIAGAEKAAAAAVYGFVSTTAVGYVATGDWRSLLYGVAGAAVTGVGTYLAPKNSTQVAR